MLQLNITNIIEAKKLKGNMTIRVAIVEDDPKVKKNLEIFIEGSEDFHCVATYGDAESALKFLPSVSLEVVLMDINLPEMNGIECVRQLKQKLPEVHVIMLTVYEDTQKIFSSLQAGAVGYLLKSSRPDEILQAIIDVNAGGSPMTAQIARKVVQSFHRNNSKNDDLVKLTDRENEVLDLLSKGYIYKEIADHLFISPDTVHNHLRHIYEKLHVHSRTEAVVKYLRK